MAYICVQYGGLEAPLPANLLVCEIAGASRTCGASSVDGMMCCAFSAAQQSMLQLMVQTDFVTVPLDTQDMCPFAGPYISACTAECLMHSSFLHMGAD